MAIDDHNRTAVRPEPYPTPDPASTSADDATRHGNLLGEMGRSRPDHLPTVFPTDVPTDRVGTDQPGNTYPPEGAGIKPGGGVEPHPERTIVRPSAPVGTVIRPIGEVVEPSVDIRPAPSAAVPGYEIEKELGRGTMGVVYLARQTALKRAVALKMILSGAHSDPVTQARFEIEAEAVAAVRHPYVVEVHDFGWAGGLPYFSLEFVGGGTLADRLRKEGKFAPRAAAEVVAKLAAGMAAVHARGIIHRDLKPANVLLTEDGEPKVTDFGLARIGQSDMTATNAVMGTPSYMSPEQAGGKTREVGPHSDVWSLGAILYDLLTGRPPFRGETVIGTIQQVLTQEPARPRAIDATISWDLETICLKCLAKEPAKRYATAAELGADLQAFLDGRPITARPVGRAERAVKWVKRNPVVTGAAAAVVLAMTVGTTVSYLKYRDAEEQKEFAQQEAAKADRAADYLVSVFEFADAKGERSTRTARQILDAAEKDIPEKFADQPELRDKLLKQIGAVYDKITANAPLAMILESRGLVQLHATRDPGRRAVPQTLLYTGDRLSLGSEGHVRVVVLSDLHQEWLRPGMEATIRRKGSEPAAAVGEQSQDSLMTFVRLPKGTFYMGFGSGLFDVKTREMIQRQKGVKTEIKENFEIGAHDVTQGQWEAVMGNNPSHFSRFGGGRVAVQDISDEELKLFPVESVSWDDCQEFLKKLNEKEKGTGWVYRLPSEAEWEYSYRGGATSEEGCSYYFYFDKPTNDLSSAQANFNGNFPFRKGEKGPFLRRTTRVGAYPSNTLGLCDMLGNVLQWCEDPADPKTASFRVNRGCAFDDPGRSCEWAYRIAPQTSRFKDLGLRLARVPSAPAGK